MYVLTTMVLIIVEITGYHLLPISILAIQYSQRIIPKQATRSIVIGLWRVLDEPSPRVVVLLGSLLLWVLFWSFSRSFRIYRPGGVQGYVVRVRTFITESAASSLLHLPARLARPVISASSATSTSTSATASTSSLRFFSRWSHPTG